MATGARHCERSEAIHDPGLHGLPRYARSDGDFAQGPCAVAGPIQTARDDDHRYAFVYLASQSPRRRQLLEQLGVAYELLLPAAHEDAEALEAVLPHEAPLAYVQRVTQLKLDAALQRLQDRALPPAPVLCSDTTVALGRSILGKPTDHQDADRMLATLSGKTHRVLTAVALGTAQARQQAVSISRVTFAPMTPEQIHGYAVTGEPMGKAGAYAVQGRAAAYISKLSGSYSGIMGLPMYETAQLLQAFGFKL